MTYAQLRYKFDCAIASKQPSAALQDIKQDMYDFCLSHCEHPRRIYVSNPDTGERYPIDAPCGKCYHCVETRQNEWVTRMWHETSLGHKFCYFTTLTYSSYKKYEDIPSKLLDAFWHYDNLNENKAFSYSPCLCRIEHLQYFLRNLRNDLASEGYPRKITYFACQELGKKYGRPHFHLIIWSDTPLTTEMIEKAWSIRSGRKNLTYVPIGRIEHDDLTNNGTIIKDKTVKIDGNNYSVQHAFKYVAKYVCKSESYNSQRLEFFVKSMQKKLDLFYFSPRVLRLIIPNYDKCINYEESLFKKQFSAYFFNLLHPTSQCTAFDVKCFNQILRPFVPSTTCSRAQGIGSIFLKTNIDALVQGRLDIVDPDLGKLVLPSFYLRKVKEEICPYEFRSVYSLSSSFSKGFRKKILSDFAKLAGCSAISKDYEDLCNYYTFPFRYYQEQVWIRDSRKCIRIANTGQRVLLILKDNGFAEYLYARYYKYDKSSNKYLLQKEESFHEFYEKFAACCSESEKRSKEIIDKAWKQLGDNLYIEDNLNGFLVSNGFGDINELKNETYSYQNNQRIDMHNKNYIKKRNDL